ncbi:MAG: hypothetical protein WC263_05390 [Candidatus Micrarchaeia archaeon]|jgi:hypothetical protein
MLKRARFVKPEARPIRNDGGRELPLDLPTLRGQAPVIRPEIRFGHGNGAHVLGFGNAPEKGWARKRARALFRSFKLLPLDEKIDTYSGAIKRACEPAGGLKSIITMPVQRGVACRIFGGNAWRGRSVLVFDEKGMTWETLASAVESGRNYSLKAVALVRGVPLAMHKSLLFGVKYWKESGEFAGVYRHLDGVSVRHPSAEKFNTTGNDELLARGGIMHGGKEHEFSACVQNPRMEGNQKICDFAFIVTNDRHLTADKLGRLRSKGNSLESWLGERFSGLEVALARLVPESMKGAGMERVLFREPL